MTTLLLITVFLADGFNKSCVEVPGFEADCVPPTYLEIDGRKLKYVGTPHYSEPYWDELNRKVVIVMHNGDPVYQEVIQ